MKLESRVRQPVEFNNAPMVDMMFTVLIFVVVSAKFSDLERLDVTLPSAAAGRAANVDALMIEIDQDGAIAVEGRIVAPEDLDEEVARQRLIYDRVVLLADSESELQPAVDVISTVKLAGYDAVAIATRPPEAP